MCVYESVCVCVCVCVCARVECRLWIPLTRIPSAIDDTVSRHRRTKFFLRRTKSISRIRQSWHEFFLLKGTISRGWFLLFNIIGNSTLLTLYLSFACFIRKSKWISSRVRRWNFSIQRETQRTQLIRETKLPESFVTKFRYYIIISQTHAKGTKLCNYEYVYYEKIIPVPAAAFAANRRTRWKRGANRWSEIKWNFTEKIMGNHQMKWTSNEIVAFQPRE